MVIRDPAALAALCGHQPPRADCHLCTLASRPAVATAKPCGKPDCGCGCSDKAAAYFSPGSQPPSSPPIPSPIGTVVIDQGASGIGDGLLGLLAVAGLKAERPGESVGYRVSKAAMPWVALFDGCDALGVALREHSEVPVPDGRQMNVGFAAEWEQRAAPGRRRVDRYRENIGAESLVMPTLREAEWVKSLGTAFAGRIVLAPWSQDARRTWPLANWVDLERRLNADGWPTAIVGGAGADARGFRGRVALGLPPAWVAGILLHSRLVIGNDSGMCHLAGVLGVPTLVLCGQGEWGPYSGEPIYGEYPAVSCVNGPVTPEQLLFQARERAAPTTVDSLAELHAVMAGRLGGYANEMAAVTRDKTMPWLFREIENRFAVPYIVETGCVRSAEDWSAGYATWLFGAYLTIQGLGRLTSVDNDPNHLATAAHLCRRWADRITFVESCSVEYLRRRQSPIHVAYLDSMDTWHPGHAEHGLAEAKAAANLVAPNGLIVFDDTPPDRGGGWQGKGRLAVPWLLAHGWRVHPVSDYQTILERTP